MSGNGQSGGGQLDPDFGELYQNRLQVEHKVRCHKSYELHYISWHQIDGCRFQASISGTEAAIRNISQWNPVKTMILTAFFICRHVLPDDQTNVPHSNVLSLPDVRNRYWYGDSRTLDVDVCRVQREVINQTVS